MEVQTIYNELPDIHDWAKLTPFEFKYFQYPTRIILTATKIVDIYYTLCTARMNLHFLDNQDFGDYAKDEVSKKLIKSMHLQNSLIFYNIAVDYSWQMLWLFYNDSLDEVCPTTEVYDKATEDCTYEKLLLGLTLKQDFKMRDGIVKPFFDGNEYYHKIRSMYNYLKHRGSYHFEGLGTNRRTMMFGFQRESEKVDLQLVTRREMNIDDTKQLLLNFDRAFVAYMSYQIKLLLPPDFDKTSITFEEMLNGLINYKT